jgi:hypothetical protein
MQGYEAFEKQNAHKKRVIRATRVVEWTLENLSGEVSRLEAAVTGPLQSIQLLFSQQML